MEEKGKRTPEEEVEAVYPHWKRNLAFVGLGSWSDVMDVMVFTLLIGVLAAYWGFGPVEVGALLGAYSLGGIVNGIVGGSICDRIGRKRAWILGNILIAFVYAGYIFLKQFELIYLARAFGGFMGGLSSLAGNVLMAEVAPPTKRQFVVGANIAIGVIGMFNGSLLIIGSGLWGFTIFVVFGYIALFNVAVAIIGYFLIGESPLWLRKTVREKEPVRKYLATPGFSTKLIMILAMAVFAGLCTTPSFMFFGYYLSAILKGPTEWVGYCDAISLPFAAVTRLIAGRIADRYGRLPTFILYAIGTIIGANLMYRTHSIIGVGTVAAWAWYTAMFSLAYTFTCHAVTLCQITWTNELMPTRIRGTVFGWTQILVGLLGVFGSPIIGWFSLFMPMGDVLATLPVIGGVGTIILALIAMKLRLETKGAILA